MKAPTRVEQLVKETRAQTTPGGDERLLRDAGGAIDKALAERQAGKRYLTPLFMDKIGEILMRLMRNGYVQVGVAAMIVCALIVAVHLSGGRVDGTSVAWADVAKKVAEVEGFSSEVRTRVRYADGRQSEWDSKLYASIAFGLRQDDRVGGKVTQINYVPDSNVATVVWPQTKMYMRAKTNRESSPVYNPRSFVELFTSTKHVDLGQSVIDGLAVEGIGAEFSPTKTGKIWVNTRTLWPVRIEMKWTAMVNGERTEFETVQDRFEWGIAFEPNQFTPVIPADYTQSNPFQMPGKKVTILDPNDARGSKAAPVDANNAQAGR